MQQEHAASAPTPEELAHIVILDEDYLPHCDRCGSRTDFVELEGGLQRHFCRKQKGCGHIFLAGFDEDME